MDQLLRLTPCWHKVEEPATAQPFGVQSEDPSRQDVATTEIVEEPTIEPKLGQASLNGFQIEHVFTPVKTASAQKSDCRLQILDKSLTCSRSGGPEFVSIYRSHHPEPPFRWFWQCPPREIGLSRIRGLQGLYSRSRLLR